MASWLACALLLFGLPIGPQVSAGFAAVLPTGVVADVSRWEVVSGSFETPTEAGSYILYVNPANMALYQLMRYRVVLHAAKGSFEESRSSVERVAFIPRPGVREPMLCWERLEGEAPGWREVAAGTDAYRLEMGVLMRVLAAHRAARLGQATH
jgi:hypothetical protein